jgi:hypothetical protein
MTAAYASHPEPKSLGPDGSPCHRGTRGVLTRRHVTPAGLVHIGKEANRLEDREAGLLTDQDLNEYQTVYATPTPTSWADTLQVLRRLDARLLAEQAGVSQRRLRDILKGTATPHTGLRDRLHTIVRQGVHDTDHAGKVAVLAAPAHRANAKAVVVLLRMRSPTFSRPTAATLKTRDRVTALSSDDLCGMSRQTQTAPSTLFAD